jgi:hypothetical protein
VAWSSEGSVCTLPSVRRVGLCDKEESSTHLDASEDVDGFRLRGVVVQGEALTDGLLV